MLLALMYRLRAISLALAALPVALAILLGGPLTAGAQTLDLSLNVHYNNPGSLGSGGSWELVGKSSGSGIAGVSALLTPINLGAVQREAPRGTVNSSDPAGFSTFQTFTNPAGFVGIVMGQVPNSPGAGEDTSIFYGVGTLANGAPNYPGKPPGTNSIGPVLASLTSVIGEPWSSTDVFGEVAWDTAALLASGTFAPGVMPGFYESGSNRSNGSVFSTTNFNSLQSATVTTIVRTNFSGVLLPDYNGNGIVDAADYTIWRDTLGQTGSGRAADGNGDQMVDQADYDLWKLHFGAAVGSGSGLVSSAAAVPEPSGLLLAVLGALMAAGRRPTRRFRLHEPASLRAKLA